MNTNFITYTVTYKRPWFLGRKVTLKNCIGDGIEIEAGFRFFDLLNGEKIYVPLNSEVTFSKERNLAIEKSIQEQVGK